MGPDATKASVLKGKGCQTRELGVESVGIVRCGCIKDAEVLALAAVGLVSHFWGANTSCMESMLGRPKRWACCTSRLGQGSQFQHSWSEIVVNKEELASGDKIEEFWILKG